MTSQITSQHEGPRMSTPDFHAFYEKLGDMEATLRVVKHDQANMASDVKGIAALIINQGHLTEDVNALKAEVRQLQIEKFRREGAVSLFEWASKHWPFLGLSGVLIAWVGYANEVFK